MIFHTKPLTLVSIGTVLALSAGGAYANAISADYTKASVIDGDEGTVAAFNLYDFAVGATLSQAAIDNVGTRLAPVIGDKFTGFYQSYVTSHQLDGIVQSAPGLNTTGSGAGYELTVIAQYDEVVTSIGPGGSYNSSITGGTATLFFDTTPDFDFIAGTGFDNGEALVSGNVVSGGAVSIPSLGAGFAQVGIAVTGQNSDVFSPDVAAANGVFTLALNSSAITGVTSVLGRAVTSSDLLLGADGNLQLQAVPVPAAVWLMGSALVGLTSIRRRAKG